MHGQVTPDGVTREARCGFCHGTKNAPLSVPSGLHTAYWRRVFMRDFPDQYSEDGTRRRCDAMFHRAALASSEDREAR